MESLALLVAAIFLTVVLSGPVAWLFTVNGYVYIGGTLGLFAILAGGWWSLTAIMPVAMVGWVSAALGAWCVLQAWRGKAPY